MSKARTVTVEVKKRELYALRNAIDVAMEANYEWAKSERFDAQGPADERAALERAADLLARLEEAVEAQVKAEKGGAL